MAHCLYKANELSLIRRHLQVPGSEWLAEEGQGSGALKYSAKPRARRIAVHYELLGEVGKVQDRRRGQRLLEGVERPGCFVGPLEAVLAQRSSLVRGAATLPKSLMKRR
jgi:hypothetical protein